MLPALCTVDGLPQASSANDATEAPVDVSTVRKGLPILKYDDPVLARPRPGFDMGLGHDSLPQYVALYSLTDERQQQKPPIATGRFAGSGNSGPSGAQCKRPRGHSKDETSAVLKAIIPNKEWETEEGDWVQTVSGAEWSRAELESVQSNVDERVATLQARPGAVCAVREQIFSELYDEVIRQVTLQCPERGLLLLRLRDEARMNLETYAEIYRDSVVFSRRKAEGAQEELEGARSKLTDLNGQTACLHAQISSLEAELTVVNRSNAYAKATTDQEHANKLQIVRAEQTALESAIAKFQKKAREATAAASAS